MIDDLIREHGWHVLGELAVLALVTIFTAFYVAALLRGRVRALQCARCGRTTSRIHRRCPRCGESLGG